MPRRKTQPSSGWGGEFPPPPTPPFGAGAYSGFGGIKQEDGTFPAIKQESGAPRAIKQEDGAPLARLAMHNASTFGKRRATSPPAGPRASQRAKLSNSMIAFKVGANPPETVHIHETLLPSNSKIFSSTLGGEPQEGGWKEIALVDEEAETFRLYKDWLYMETVCVRVTSITDMTWGDHSVEWTKLAKLYVLSLKFEDHKCCNAVMEAMIHKLEETDPQGRRWWPSDQNIAILYNGTSPGSPVRDLLLDAYLHFPAGADTLISLDDGLNHPAFLADLARALLKNREVECADDHFSSQGRRFFIGGRDEDQVMG
ncbi:hypothetical protein PRZ48_013006 [Zasmidium cellare]|uniref:BTB domain-containing protein n=1 Tax=Zasmidium cellare TaxID=395010 RepID=A0ABR0E2T8_ZASCE|nr:hypothetical protein PRZ48_013006 [Zasmidium cellare]